jgi:choice-of-anchor A domain-containing protein
MRFFHIYKCIICKSLAKYVDICHKGGAVYGDVPSCKTLLYIERTMKKIYWAVLALPLLLPAFAQGAQLNLNNLFGRFDVIANSLDYHSESEGPVIAGQFNLANTNQIGKNVSVGKDDPILIAEHIINAGGSMLHVDKGSVYSQTTPAPILDFTGGGKLYEGTSPFSFMLTSNTGGYTTVSSVLDAFQDYSAYLDSVPVNGTMSITDPNAFTFTGNGSQFTFIDIAGSDLVNAHGVGINLNGSTTMVIDVTGDDLYIHANPLGGTSDVIWNFTGHNVTFTGGRWNGSILDPNGSVDLEHGATGLVVGNIVIGKDEFHYNYMTAPPMPVPEPGECGLLALAACITLRRRRS